MKTIKAIFTTEPQAMPMGRRYSFNTTLDVEEGDVIVSPDYNGKLLQVVAVEKKVYKSFSYSKGELFEEVIEQKGYGQIKLLSEECSIYSDSVNPDDKQMFRNDIGTLEVKSEDEGF